MAIAKFDQTCSSLECDGGFETVTGQNSLSDMAIVATQLQHAVQLNLSLWLREYVYCIKGTVQNRQIW